MIGYSLLACPKTGAALRWLGGQLESRDGRQYAIKDDIADLLDLTDADEATCREAELFNSIPLSGVSYFRASLYEQVCQELSALLPGGRAPVCAEIGGGEGWFARHFIDCFPGSVAFVCDIARRPLTLADPRTVRVLADARLPFVQAGTLDVAAFWVSLHHFPPDDMRRCLETAARSLRPGGILLVFEPNQHFLPRRLFYNMPLSRLVYYDDDECAVAVEDLCPVLEDLNFRQLSVRPVQPPYSVKFLKHFRMWRFFYAFVEFMHILDRRIMNKSWWAGRGLGIPPLWSGSYVLASWQKGGSP